MPNTTDVRVNDLIINKMTQEQYDALQEKSPTELYVIEGDSNLIYAEQATVLPTASASNLGKIYQSIGTTDALYTNGYFYRCISDGAVEPTYSWEQVNVQPQVDPLPDQTGHNGEFLTTNGTVASWATVDALPSQTGQAGKILGTDGTNAAWEEKTTVSFRTWGANE